MIAKKMSISDMADRLMSDHRIHEEGDGRTKRNIQQRLARAIEDMLRAPGYENGGDWRQTAEELGWLAHEGKRDRWNIPQDAAEAIMATPGVLRYAIRLSEKMNLKKKELAAAYKQARAISENYQAAEIAYYDDPSRAEHMEFDESISADVSSDQERGIYVEKLVTAIANYLAGKRGATFDEEGYRDRCRLIGRIDNEIGLLNPGDAPTKEHLAARDILGSDLGDLESFLIPSTRA